MSFEVIPDLKLLKVELFSQNAFGKFIMFQSQNTGNIVLYCMHLECANQHLCFYMYSVRKARQLYASW